MAGQVHCLFLPFATLLFFALVGLVPGLWTMATLTNITTDHSTLLSLKSHFSLDPSHSLLMNWSDSATSTSICTWIGVTCGSRHQRVTGLDLSLMNLTGILPPQIGNLSFLVSLNLSRNNLYGNMPQELARLGQPRVLDLNYNSLSGDIPSSLGLLSKLLILSLRNNSFSGLIPLLSNMSNLEALDLSFNSLQGNIPEEMGHLINLKTLRLNRNQISGSIPSSLFNISAMEDLELLGNSLQGNLPQNLCTGRYSRLQVLSLSANDFYGEIPISLSNCSQLQGLSLSYNHFSGSIPKGIGNLRRLEILYLGDNRFSGEIPGELSNITLLRELDMPNNQFTGFRPAAFNISSLQFINCARNNLSGMLPSDMCFHLKQLQEAYFQENNLYGTFPTRLYECSSLRVLFLTSNELSGVLPTQVSFILQTCQTSFHLQYLYPVEVLTVCRPQCSLGVIPNEIGNLINLEEMALGLNNFGSTIPVSIFNMSALLQISLSGNQLVGNIPSDLGTGLPNLQVLHLFENNLSSASGELSFLTSLSMNCINLRDLEIGPNPLNGVLPPSIRNFSASLQILYLDNCGLSGSIPDEIGNLSSLVNLQLHRNSLTGKLPGTLANIQSLQGLFLFDNRIMGTIPTYICKLERLSTVYLNGNGIDGPIPACIGNITTLRVLDLSSNNLNSTIPLSLWNITDILQLNLSSNRLTGLLPLEVGNLRSANLVDLSQNELSGTIPPSIGNLQDLETFSLADNRLRGSIPETVAEMVNLQFLDLSHNNLSGMIPPSMEKLVHLFYLNISFNGLSGSIPSGGPFENFTSSSFMFNKDLCGDPRYNVTPCQEKKATTSKTKWKLRVVYIVLGTSIFVIVIVLLAYRFARAIMKHKATNGLDVWPGPTRQRISYYELVEATDGYNKRNLIGSGSFGSVYRGTLKNGKVVAVKVFHRLTEEDVDSFEVECNVLRGLRHRNLCKVIGSCSNKDFKALILDYMPRSLEKLLYPENCSLDLVQMISIMIDVAAALEYLHYGYSVPIVHCDLKPSNILLDEDMVGHVCDFGLAKLLGDGETTTQTITLATIGYMAPEFGTDARVSVRCDVYSYGITLMEVLTGKKPTDDMFAENSSLSSWVRDSMTCSILDIINRNLVQENEACTILKVNCLHSVLKLALQCSSQSPHDRISIKDANASLKKIRARLLQGLRT